MEERQPVLHAHVPAAGRDRLVQGIVARRRPEQDPVAGPEARDRRLVQQHLAHRLERRALQRAGGALGGGVEGADALELVAEEIQAHRFGAARRKDVDDAPADGVFAGLHDRSRAHVAAAGEERHQRLGVQRPALGGVQGRTGEDGARRHPLQERRHRGQDHPPGRLVPCRFQKPGQGVDAAADDLAVGRNPVVGQAVPGGEFQPFGPRREEGERLGHARQAHVVAGDEHEAGPGVPGEPGKEQRVEALGRPGDQQPAGPFQLLR